MNHELAWKAAIKPETRFSTKGRAASGLSRKPFCLNPRRLLPSALTMAPVS